MTAYRPLRNVRILAFESAFSLPSGTRTLADLGAQVVRVGRPDIVAGPLTTQADGGRINKPALSIDLQTEAGRELTRRLVMASDAVCNNYRPRVMKRFALDYEALRKIKPDVIVLQLSGYGSGGPWGDFPAYGPSVEAAGGLNSLTGDESELPMRIGSGVFADQVGGRYAALALVAALERRRRTGEGQFLDVSMYEGIVHLIGEYIIAAALSQAPPRRYGNRDPLFAPQGVYPCAGEDEWVALSVETDDQWRALCRLLTDPRLQDPQMETAEERRCRADVIDAAIADWTGRHPKLEAAEMLQRAGIPGGPVQKVQDAPLDPQLEARGAFRAVRHRPPVLGYAAHPHLTLPWIVRGRGRPPLEDARYDGQDNVRILKKWLGLAPSEIKRLRAEGALLPIKRVEVTRDGAGLGRLDPEFAQRLGLPLE